MNELTCVGQQTNVLIVKGLKLATSCPVREPVYLCINMINRCVPIPWDFTEGMGHHSATPQHREFCPAFTQSAQDLTGGRRKERLSKTCLQEIH